MPSFKLTLADWRIAVIDAKLTAKNIAKGIAANQRFDLATLLVLCQKRWANEATQNEKSITMIKKALALVQRKSDSRPIMPKRASRPSRVLLG